MDEILTLIVVVFVVVSLYWQYHTYTNSSSLLYKIRKLEEKLLEQQDKILNLIKINDKTQVERNEKSTERTILSQTSDNSATPSEIDKQFTDKSHSDNRLPVDHDELSASKSKQSIFQPILDEPLSSNTLKNKHITSVSQNEDEINTSTNYASKQENKDKERISLANEFLSEQQKEEKGVHAYQQAPKTQNETAFDKVSPIEANKRETVTTQPVISSKEEGFTDNKPKMTTNRFAHHYRKESSQDNVQVTQYASTGNNDSTAISKPINRDVQERTVVTNNTTLKNSNKDNQQRSIIALIWQWVITGNPLAKIGILLLFFGLSYLLKYSIENELISASTRLMMAGSGCLALLGIGWWLRKKNLTYALILQGGGIGGLYITIFAATKIYDFIPIGIALAIMVFICLVSVVLAVIHRAISLAVLASLGGYLAPVLLSTGSGNYIALFSYYLILSIGILAISHWQVWRLLNLIGFAFTFGIGFLWAIPNYTHADYLPCQLFLMANWFIFGVATELSTLKNKLKLNIPFDATLLFGTPLIGFIFQHRLASEWEYGVAIASSLYALVYFALTWFTLKRYREEGKLLSIAFFMLSATFATLAVPFAFSAEWTSMVWAIEGVMILAFSVLQKQKNPAYAGTILIAISFVLLISMRITEFNQWSMFVTQVIVIFVAATLWYRAQFINIDSRSIGFIALFIGVISWIYSLLILTEYGAIWFTSYNNLVVFCLILISCWLMYFAGKKSHFFEFASCSILLWPVSALLMLLYLANAEALIDSVFSGLIWTAILSSGFYLLKLNTLLPKQRLKKSFIHASHLGFIAFFLLIEMVWLINHFYFQISLHLAVAIFFICLYIVLSYLLGFKVNWIKPYQNIYWTMTIPAFGLLILIVVMANLNSGTEMALKFIPLINPMDIMGIIGLWVSYKFITLLKQHAKYKEIFQANAQIVSYFIPAIIFWWANGVLLRGLVFSTDIDWNTYQIINSKVIQTVLAIVWAITALVTMVMATRKKSRSLWFVGGALLAIVIAKLFLIDIRLSSGLLRALAFIGVALLILLIGYFSPLPPRKHTNDPKVQE